MASALSFVLAALLVTGSVARIGNVARSGRGGAEAAQGEWQALAASDEPDADKLMEEVLYARRDLKEAWTLEGKANMSAKTVQVKSGMFQEKEFRLSKEMEEVKKEFEQTKAALEKAFQEKTFKEQEVQASRDKYLGLQRSASEARAAAVEVDEVARSVEAEKRQLWAVAEKKSDAVAQMGEVLEARKANVAINPQSLIFHLTKKTLESSNATMALARQTRDLSQAVMAQGMDAIDAVGADTMTAFDSMEDVATKGVESLFKDRADLMGGVEGKVETQ